MIVKIYDYANEPTEITVPDDKVISEIFVHILSGDETGYIEFTDGTHIDFDASNSRIMGFEDGCYTVTGENIQKWIDFDVDECDGTISYAREIEFC